MVSPTALNRGVGMFLVAACVQTVTSLAFALTFEPVSENEFDFW